MTEIDDTRQREEDAGRGLRKQASGPKGMTTKIRNVLITTTIGARAKTRRSAPSGKRSSFWSNLPTSARSCSEP